MTEFQKHSRYAFWVVSMDGEESFLKARFSCFQCQEHGNISQLHVYFALLLEIFQGYKQRQKLEGDIPSCWEGIEKITLKEINCTSRNKIQYLEINGRADIKNSGNKRFKNRQLVSDTL